MSLYVKSTLKGCLIKDDLGELIARLEYKLQPIASTKLFKISAFECLSTIQFENGYDISAEDFFGNSCSELIKKICLSQVDYFQMIDYPEDIFISYNITASALCDGSFVRKLVKGNRRRIALEVTSFDIDKPTVRVLIKIIESVRLLKNQGIEIWFDDFFHESDKHLLWLNLISWDMVKLDKFYFSVENWRNCIDEAIEIIDDIGVSIIVEGVETKEQYGFLLNKDVMIQGYILSEPKPYRRFNDFKNSLYLTK